MSVWINKRHHLVIAFEALVALGDFLISGIMELDITFLINDKSSQILPVQLRWQPSNLLAKLSESKLKSIKISSSSVICHIWHPIKNLRWHDIIFYWLEFLQTFSEELFIAEVVDVWSLNVCLPFCSTFIITIEDAW